MGCDAFTTKPAHQGKPQVGAGVLTDDGEEGAEPGAEYQPRCNCQEGGREEDQGPYGVEDDVDERSIQQSDVVEPFLEERGHAGQSNSRLPPAEECKKKQAEPEAAEDKLERRIFQLCAGRVISKGAP
mgnify:CR=1 FL=1